ncbi:MAG: toxin-antitoxin system HicB family antitoxin [Mediterranea sp.]|jgi:predicted transcriptional regulator|nr:toxin-antitoxin system HicB family antitoxin [Mediterranea sp.]
MEAITDKRHRSFRLSADLIRRLQTEANKKHVSLNRYVEEILMNEVYREPNEITLAALEEAKSETDLETLDLDNFKEYVASL